MLPGVSFVEPTLAALQLDLLPRLTVGDARHGRIRFSASESDPDGGLGLGWTPWCKEIYTGDIFLPESG